MTKTKPGTGTRRSAKPSTCASISDISLMANFQQLKGSLTAEEWKAALKTSSRTSAGRSSTLPSSLQSKLLMTGALILTIRYTCPLCLEVHFRDFPLFSSTKRRTSRRLTMQCYTRCEKVGWLQWETDGRQFMLSGVLKQVE